jgi:hypothetical protein
MTFEIDEEHRQILLLALAAVAVERPGWAFVCREIAERLRGAPLFESFLQLRQEKKGARV